MIKCAHDSGGLIGSCTSSRENCECGLYFIIEEPNEVKDRHECSSHIPVVRGESKGTPQVRRLEFGGVRAATYELSLLAMFLQYRS